jgi:hypothetical protein
MKTQWFPESKEVQDAEIIKQGVDVCFWDKDGIFLADWNRSQPSLQNTALYFSTN